MKSVAADSGPLLALFNRADTWNQPVLAWLAANPHTRLLTTWPVVTEVCALLARRVGEAAAADFLLWIERGGVTLDLPAPASFHTILAITQHDRDVPFDFADASVAELAARHGLTDVLTIDRDFDMYRNHRGKAFCNVMRLRPTVRGKPR